MAKLESDLCCAEIRFFVKYDNFLTCEVFLRLSAGGQAFPDIQRFRNFGERLATEHGLDPAEWWRGWDLGGAAYVDWIERALAGETSNLEPTEEYHFGLIAPRYGALDDPPEKRSFLLSSASTPTASSMIQRFASGAKPAPRCACRWTPFSSWRSATRC